MFKPNLQECPMGNLYKSSYIAPHKRGSDTSTDLAISDA